jgi:acyl-CoA synthetase (NDP forming)
MQTPQLRGYAESVVLRDGASLTLRSVRPSDRPLLVQLFRRLSLLRDVSFRITPVSDLDAAEMVDGLRAAKLLDGFRGSLPVDREDLVRVIQRLSALVEAFPELVELELNPLKVLPRGQGAIAVDARMRLAPGTRRPT